MSDMIYRQDVINVLEGLSACEEYGVEVGTDEETYIGKYEAITAISDLPSARPQWEWIPCSERLPKKEEATYLICTETGYMRSCRWTNDMYGLGSNEWSKWGWHIMDKPQYAKVVAWMPLKPWKGADDE